MSKVTRTDVRVEPAAAGKVSEGIDRTAFLAAIVESSDDAIVTFRPDGTVTYWNSGAEKIFGYRADEMVGSSVYVLFRKVDVEKERSTFERVSRGQRVGHYEAVNLMKDGTEIDVRVTVSPVIDGKGKIAAISAITRDISVEVSGRKLSEQRLAAASSYSRSLIESSLDPLVTISADGKITDVNEATIDVTGVSRDKLIGTDFSNYFTEPDNARKGYQQVFARGYVKDYPLTIRHVMGRLTDVLYNASVYRDTDGNVQGVFAAARDITERKAIERELAEQRGRELDRLADLEKFQKLTVGRELKMVELKKEIEQLKRDNEDLKKELAQLRGERDR